jgi:hypothetical protein
MPSILPTIEGHLAEGRTIDHVYGPSRYRQEIEARGFAFFDHDLELLIVIDGAAIEWRWIIGG